MSTPLLTFFNPKGGVGKTTLALHLAWMLAEMGKRIVAIDLDPQGDLTTALLPEAELHRLWGTERQTQGAAQTIFESILPLMQGSGGVIAPETVQVAPRLDLIPGDLMLAAFEDNLSRAWFESLSEPASDRNLELLRALSRAAQMTAQERGADLIIADIGPNLGAINRSVLLASDYLLFPLALDLFSLRALHNMGTTLQHWRNEWGQRLSCPQQRLPAAKMQPLGYVVQQPVVRLSRPVPSQEEWLARIPALFRQTILHQDESIPAGLDDPHCLARLKNYRSLASMADESHKPIFQLTAADGAIGSHALAAAEARQQYSDLATKIWGLIGRA